MRAENRGLPLEQEIYLLTLVRQATWVLLGGGIAVAALAAALWHTPLGIAGLSPWALAEYGVSFQKRRVRTMRQQAGADL